MSELVSSTELADMLGISERHIRNLAGNGFLTAKRNARGHYRFDPKTASEEFERYEQTQWRGSFRTRKANEALAEDAVSKGYAEDGWQMGFEMWWIGRKELLSYPDRVIARLFDDGGDLVSGNVDFVRLVLEEEACECMNAFDKRRKDNPIMQLRDSCPYSGMRHDYACACETEGGECHMTRQAFDVCLVSPRMLENGADGRIAPQPQ